MPNKNSISTIRERVDDLTGAARWLGPKTIYVLKWQTIAFTADDGACSYTFNGQTTSAIPFDAVAADYEAAFELLSSVGVGMVTATGDPGDVHLVFDDSIIPTLITDGTNTLEFEAAPVVPDVFVTAIEPSVALYTPQINERIVDINIEVVEAFGASGFIYFADAADGDGAWNTYPSYQLLDVADNESPNFTASSTAGEHYAVSPLIVMARSTGLSVILPTRAIVSTPLYATFESVGGTGKTTGIVNVFIQVATPAPLP